MSKKKIVNKQLNEENENAPLFARTSVASRNHNENSNNGYFQPGKPKTRRSQSTLNKERQRISHILKDKNVLSYIEQNNILYKVRMKGEQNISNIYRKMRRNLSEYNAEKRAGKNRFVTGLLRETRGTPSRSSLPLSALHQIKKYYPNAIPDQIKHNAESKMKKIRNKIDEEQRKRNKLITRNKKGRKIHRYVSELAKIYPSVSHNLSLPRGNNSGYMHLKRSFNHNEAMAATAATRRNSRLPNAEARRVLELNNGAAAGANHPNYERMTAAHRLAAARRHNGSASAAVGGNENNWEAFANSSPSPNLSHLRRNHPSGNNNGENGWNYLAQSSKPAGKLSPKK